MNKSSYVSISWIFLRFLGFVYFCAFVSLYGQLPGLLGSSGILPIAPWLHAIRESLGIKAYTYLPTLFWLNDSDPMLHIVCGLGILFSIFLMLDFLTVPSLVLLWISYLSLLNVGQDFLSFQWDILLVEAGFLAIWLPFSKNIGVWLFRWLLFRLIFMSGILKLLSGDITWHSLTALAFHYETQPLPTPLAWYLFQLPLWFHKFSTLFVLICEIVVPFGFFGHRVVRIAAGLATLFLQVMIMLTGNYAFFNLLTICLTFFLFDDALINPFLSSWAVKRIERKSWIERFAKSGKRVVTVIAVLIVTMSLIQLFQYHISDSISAISDQFSFWYFTSTYGLFVVMTTTRPEIIFEGSNDGTTWKEYSFKYQSDNLKQPPGWVAPNQPRMDWQLWFESLRPRGYSRWFVNLAQRLLEGSPTVLHLFKNNPFPNAPPKYLRAVRYQYHFTNWDTRKKTGNWWSREFMDMYLPTVSLQS